MRKLVIAAALLSTAVATPALARDGAPYLGIDAGLVRPNNLNLRFSNSATSISDAVVLKHKWGYDVDAVFGYDFGRFRVEGEASYKRTRIKDAVIQDTALHAVGAPGIGIADFNSNGHGGVFSGMLNGLVDIGPQDSFNISLGGGVGEAWANYRAGLTPTNPFNFADRDNALAWQILAEVHVPITTNLDAGIKYRHFETSKLKFGSFCDTGCGADRQRSACLR